MDFRLVPKSVTLNDLERRNGRYFALFCQIRVQQQFREVLHNRRFIHCNVIAQNNLTFQCISLTHAHTCNTI